MRLRDQILLINFLFWALIACIVIIADDHKDGHYTKEQVKAHSRLIDRVTQEKFKEREVAMIRELYGNY